MGPKGAGKTQVNWGFEKGGVAVLSHLAGHDEAGGLVAHFEDDAAVAGAEVAQLLEVVVDQVVQDFLLFLEK